MLAAAGPVVDLLVLLALQPTVPRAHPGPSSRRTATELKLRQVGGVTTSTTWIQFQRGAPMQCDSFS
eukprot:3361964-Rhodomonas_salina.1